MVPRLTSDSLLILIVPLFMLVIYNERLFMLIENVSSVFAFMLFIPLKVFMLIIMVPNK